MKLIIFNILFIALVVAEKKSYHGYSVFRLTPKNTDHLEVLKTLKNIGEFWDDQFYVNYESRIMVPAHNKKIFEDIVRGSNMEASEAISNLQSVIDEQFRPMARNARNDSYLSMTWNKYHSLEDVNNWLDELERNHPNVVSKIVMGKSVEDREIRGIKISYKQNNTSPVIGMLEGTIHAREWISTATVTWIIKEFLTSNDREIRALAENIEWHIFPVVNPDGYVYTFTTNRMWRKNRSNASFKSCSEQGADDDMSNGVDLNRNFDFVWMGPRSSNDSCVNTYAGPEAFSEPESRAIRDYVLDLNGKGKFLYYFGFHSFTQLIVIPYSHLPKIDVLTNPIYGDMYEIAIRGAEKLEERYGTKYRVGISSEILYPMSGTSFDWVKNNTDVPLSYLIELRDLGEYGFLLPPDQIIPNNLEIMDALLEMDKTTRLLGYYRSSAASIVSSLGFVLTLVFALIY